MRKYAFLPLAAIVALGACNDSPTALAPEGMNIGVASPNTPVEATAQITGPEQTITTYLSGPLPDAGGHRNRSCSGNGVYSWTTGPAQNPTNHVSQPNHSTCTTTDTIPGFEIEIEFATMANYVQPASGHIHLNFSMCGYTEQVVGYDEELGEDIIDWAPTPCTTPTYIHYKHDKKANSGMIEAAGVLSGKDELGRVWTIDFDQLNATAGPGGLAPTVKEFSNTKNKALVAVGPGGATAQATLSW